MADGISIPGVTDRYKTNDLVEALMETERIPLKREQASLERYQKQQSAWRDVNAKMSSLRTSVKTLYSFENPFSNKLASSSDENAITVDAARDADFGSFKIDVINPATSDRFLSDPIEADKEVPQGKYTFKAGEKTVDFSWKGGKLSDFVTALNKRSNNIVQARLIGISSTKKSLLIESLKPGEENSLSFENKALDFAKNIGMVEEAKTSVTTLPSGVSNFKVALAKDSVEQKGMPRLSLSGIKSNGKEITLPPRTGFELEIPEETRKNENNIIEFSYKISKTEDITENLNKTNGEPVLPDPGSIDFKGISISNIQSSTGLTKSSEPKTLLTPVQEKTHFYVRNAYDIETELEQTSFSEKDENGNIKVKLSLKDYPEAKMLIVRNGSTGETLTLTAPQSYDSTKNKGFTPVHAISTAGDAKIKYEGITLTRSTNDIDDVVPNVTLHIHDKTEKTATIKIDPDTESAKDALISFVGNYNQVIAELNILTINKPEIVSELDYLSDSEKEEANEKLGMFQGDFSLTNGKSSLQRTISSVYKASENSTITQLSQIGISSNASGNGSGYSASQMRGYLEIDEKKLDSFLESDLTEIKNLFGFDSDGDLIIDSGIGFLLDRQLSSWIQSGGIISSKTSALDTQIKNSNTKISKLETQLEAKEAELKSKYASMEGSLNSLESQSNSLNNFSNSLNNKK